MELSKEQIRILRAFYNHSEIVSADFSKYGIDEKSNGFRALVGTYITGPYRIASSNHSVHALPYKINEKGKAFIETLDAQKKRLFWSNFRSWFAFGLSIASFLLSIFSIFLK